MKGTLENQPEIRNLTHSRTSFPEMDLSYLLQAKKVGRFKGQPA